MPRLKIQLLPTRRQWKIYLTILSIILILIAADMLLVRYERRIILSPSTTYISAPLTPQGTPDYVAYLNARYSEGVTFENNAAIPLLQIIGDTTLRPDTALQPDDDYGKWMHSTLSRLGLSDAPFPSLIKHYGSWQYEKLRKFDPHPDEKKIEQEIYSTISRPWRGIDYPERAAWIATQQQAIHLAWEATNRPRLFFPLIAPSRTGSMFELVFRTYGAINTLSDSLICDAMRAAGENEFNVMIKDFESAIQLANLMNQSPVLYGTILSYNAYSAVDGGLAGVSSISSKLDSNHLLQLETLIAKYGYQHRPLQSLNETERFNILDILCATQVYGWEQFNKTYPDLMTDSPLYYQMCDLFFPTNADNLLVHANAYFTKSVEALQQPTYIEQRDAIQAIDDEERKRKSSYHYPTPDAFALFGPSLNRIPVYQTTAGVNQQLALLSLQLRRYKLLNGHFPATLEQLQSTLHTDPQLLIDGFSEKPFIYRTNADSSHDSYTLYSVGVDLHDDRGRVYAAYPPLWRTDGRRGYDIVIHGD